MRTFRDHNPARTAPVRWRGAFTLVEILIVVVILGILATIVVPQFSNASQQARENTLKDELRYLRTQLIVFRAQHRDVPVGYPGGNPAAVPTEAAFIQQMTLPSDDNCNTNSSSSAVFHNGPYLTKIPPNPKTQMTTIKMVPNGQPMPQPDGTTGWIYKPQTVQIMANVTGTDTNGTLFSNY